MGEKKLFDTPDGRGKKGIPTMDTTYKDQLHLGKASLEKFRE
jgi:hypothetical protein